MSGTKDTTIVHDEPVLFKFSDFAVHTATFYSEELDSHESGYAVVWLADKVTQVITNNVAAAVNFALTAAQTIAMAKELLEHQAKA